ncbi:MAG: MarR family winged helix-turn-helix transcriptional regulator [Anaerofustis sp.]
MAKKKDEKKKKDAQDIEQKKQNEKDAKAEVASLQELKDAAYFKAASAVYRFGQSFYGAKLKAFGLDKGQWGFLTELMFHEDGITQEELSERLAIDKSNTTRALKALEDAGYITRTEDPMTRKKTIFLTDSAKSKQEDIGALQQECNDILLSGFSDEEMKKARKLMERMQENIAAYRSEPTDKEADIQ